MLLKQLREEVLEANLELVRRGLVLYTFGNASGVDREEGLIVIKPSGVDYAELRPQHMVVTDLDGNIVEGDLRPSSDLDTHTLLYREFSTIGAVVHTHSEYATSFAQAGMPIPPFGTTHADYFYGPVPVTDPLSEQAIAGRYVHETGLAIVARFTSGGLDPMAVPACLVGGPRALCMGTNGARCCTQCRCARSGGAHGSPNHLVAGLCRRGFAGTAGPPLLPQTRSKCDVWSARARDRLAHL